MSLLCENTKRHNSVETKKRKSSFSLRIIYQYFIFVQTFMKKSLKFSRYGSDTKCYILNIDLLI